MSVLKSNDGKELFIDCECKCGTGVMIRVNKDCDIKTNDDHNMFVWCSLLNGKWYGEQEKTIKYILIEKLKKIFAIIFNKDFYYSEIYMDHKNFEIFREYINGIK